MTLSTFLRDNDIAFTQGGITCAAKPDTLCSWFVHVLQKLQVV